MSLQAISSELAARGFVNERGAPFNPKSIGRAQGRPLRPSARTAREKGVDIGGDAIRLCSLSLKGSFPLGWARRELWVKVAQ